MMPTDARRHSAAAERNRGPILEVLQRVLPPRGRALEVAAGTGQHALHFAAGLPGWTWCPSDPDPSALASIAAWAADATLPNMRPPVELDVLAMPWAVQGPFDAIFCANMLHISPWATCAALMQGAAQVAAADAVLLTYGPYFVEGQVPSPGNVAFDADLRARDPAWGLRFVHDVQAQALAAGWRLAETVPMPANNLTLVFRRARGAA
jgi:SAM-dependent methyltransferase